MQNRLQHSAFHRVLLLGLMTAFIIALSWWLTPTGELTSRLEEVSGYISAPRQSAAVSTDAQIAVLQERLLANPDDWQAYSLLGQAFLQKARETGDPGYYRKAEEALEKALAVEPGDYASISAKGALALARHEFSEALEWGQRAVEINPDRSHAYGVIADAQIELGLYAEAVETLQTMVDLRPDMSAYARISYVRELHGDLEGAVQAMRLAVDSGVATSESTAWVRSQLGNLYFNSGDLERAEFEYLRTLHNRPDYVYALAGLGRVRAAQGEMEEAIELLIRASAIMPLPEFVITLGELYEASGRPEEAALQYGLVAAIEQLHRAGGVDMDMEIALFHADRGQNLEETVELARSAYLNRPSIHAADVLAWALYQSGEYQEAQDYSEAALHLGTQDALKIFHAGMIELQLGDEAQARDYLEQALAINPHFSIPYADEARRILQSLQAAK